MSDQIQANTDKISVDSRSLAVAFYFFLGVLSAFVVHLSYARSNLLR